MLNAANNFDSFFVIYKFNKLILNLENIRNIDNVKYAIYYHSILLH